jgi:hypothetical protein
MYYESENYLAHHGIKGQKWGIRRFQNPDGTRTAAGRKREKANREVDHDKLVKSTNAKELYKNRKQLSDKELQDRLNRLRNEQELKRMADNSANGKLTVKKILKDNGKEIVKELSKNAMRAGVIAAGKAIAKKALPLIAGYAIKLLAKLYL